MKQTTAIDAVVNSYKGLSGVRGCGTPIICSFAAFSDDGKHHESTYAYVCHSSMKYWAKGVHDTMITSYPNCDVQFFDFMKNVLFRKWSDHFHLEQHESGVSYIRISDLGKLPANIAYNFCITSRIPVEFTNELYKWKAYVAMGIHPTFALACCPYVFDNKGVVTRFDLANSNHWPQDNWLNLRRLVSCEPKGVSASYKSNPFGCAPCNILWNADDSAGQDMRNIKGQTVLDFWNKWKAENEDILLAS